MRLRLHLLPPSLHLLPVRPAFVIRQRRRHVVSPIRPIPLLVVFPPVPIPIIGPAFFFVGFGARTPRVCEAGAWELG